MILGRETESFVDDLCVSVQQVYAGSEGFIQGGLHVLYKTCRPAVEKRSKASRLSKE